MSHIRSNLLLIKAAGEALNHQLNGRPVEEAEKPSATGSLKASTMERSFVRLAVEFSNSAGVLP
jgi:hypothetical protein